MAKTVLDLLVLKYPTAKRQTLRRMLQAGRVRVGGRLVRVASQEVGEDAALQVDEHPSASRPAPPGPRRRLPSLEIVYEDDDLLVVNKPPGLLTSTGPRESRPTLLANVRAYVEPPIAKGARPSKTRVGLIHRLDRDASGLLVFSKNDAAYRSLKTQFFHHTVDRGYAAVVHGKPHPPTGRVQTHLVERSDGRVYSTTEHGKGEWALTDYEVVKTQEKKSLLRVMLQTGRKHQIRVHLSEKGWPILGDSVYGREGDDAPRLMLAAVKLSVAHPRTGKRMTWDIPLPKGFPMNWE